MKSAQRRSRSQAMRECRPLNVECLDGRVLPSVSCVNGILTIEGTNRAEIVGVNLDPNGDGGGNDLLVSVNGSPAGSCANVTALQINTWGGNDRVTIGAGVIVPSTISGGNGNDNIEGGDVADDIHGGNGNDVIDGDDGNDVLHGDNGNDHVMGGDGNDELHGDNGKDSEEGGADDDVIHGETGPDHLSGDAGNDDLFGETGPDVMDGGDGDDELDGGDAPDMVLGGSGNDLMHGGKGNDQLDGGDGEDLADGDEGTDDVENAVAADLESEFQADFTNPSTGASLHSEFERDQEGDGLELEFKVELDGLAPNTTFHVLIDGIDVGQILTDAGGQGELKFSNDPDDSDEAAFPEPFPEIHIGSTVLIQDTLGNVVLQASFAMETEDD